MNPQTLWNILSLGSNGLTRKNPVKRHHETPPEVAEKLKTKAEQKRQRRAQRNLENDRVAKAHQYKQHPEVSNG